MLSRETQVKHVESGNKMKKNDNRPRSRNEETSPVIKSETERCAAILNSLVEVPGKIYDVSSVTGQVVNFEYGILQV